MTILLTHPQPILGSQLPPGFQNIPFSKRLECVHLPKVLDLWPWLLWEEKNSPQWQEMFEFLTGTNQQLVIVLPSPGVWFTKHPQADVLAQVINLFVNRKSQVHLVFTPIPSSVLTQLQHIVKKGGMTLEVVPYSLYKMQLHTIEDLKLLETIKVYPTNPSQLQIHHLSGEFVTYKSFRIPKLTENQYLFPVPWKWFLYLKKQAKKENHLKKILHSIEGLNLDIKNSLEII